MELLVSLQLNITMLEHLFDVRGALAKLVHFEPVFDKVLFGDEPLNPLVALLPDLLLRE
jgi:hypothetical protein